jgi:8-oxo-dGTP pyrophosphatase MutT (NUDIX family)
MPSLLLDCAPPPSEQILFMQKANADSMAHQVAALPWRRDRNGSLAVLLVTSRTNGKWMLPKGWPMTGKADSQAAQLEAFEEAGVEGNVLDSPLGSYHFMKLFDDGACIPAQAVIYALQVTRERKQWREKGQRRRKWFGPARAARAVYEPDLARFLRGLAAGRVVLTPTVRR